MKHSAERSEAYVRRGLAREALISVAYAIGIDEPVMLHAINESQEEITHLIDSEIFRETIQLEIDRVRVTNNA